MLVVTGLAIWHGLLCPSSALLFRPAQMDRPFDRALWLFSLVRSAALRAQGSIAGVQVLALEIQMILQAER